ncbi:PREDICTED: neuroblast differentiation-associated protein AHNAK-like, partial [Merops nubicus]|uniref:neuroblast differentiation-associated protein AHNAK-like n=1 Tax=Merops nubicus TaxID=57421 RepID=UPI0004F0BA88
DDTGKSKTSLFRMPKVSVSRISKSQSQIKSIGDSSVSEALSYSITEEAPSVLSDSFEHKFLPEKKLDSSTKNIKFRIPNLGFSRVDIGSSKVEQDSSLPKADITLTKYQINLAESESKISSFTDENVSITDFEILSEDGSFEKGSLKPDGNTLDAEIPVGDTDFTVKIPKFRKPKFGISWSKGKQSESDIVSKVQPEIFKGKLTSDMIDSDIEKVALITDAKFGVKMHKPSPQVALDAPNLDDTLPSAEVTVPQLEVESRGPGLDYKAEHEVVSGEKDTEEKENKFKTSKFKLPSFSWSPKKEVIASSEAEGHVEEPALSGDTESELTFPTSESQYFHVEFDTSTEKDGEKDRNKKPQFVMPKIPFPKIKGQKVQVSPPILETDICGPRQEKESVSVQKSERGSCREGAGKGIKMPKVTVPTLEFSKPEVKVPKTEMDISMPTDDLKLKSAPANAGLPISDIKMITEGSFEVKSSDTSVERTSGDIAVGDVETKTEGPEGKTKMSKFQMPKFGITHSKGKGSEKVSQSKSEVKVPQLKAMIEIADIAFEAPNLDVQCGTREESHSLEVKITEADNKTSADISIPKTDRDVQDSEEALRFKGEIKQDGDGEEKEGHFKMPKFKLPSFSWSPKKEASVKPDSGANLEDHKLTVMSSRVDTEVRGTATDGQGTGPALDLEISAGKVEQKSAVKKPQFVMPKISLSKIKVHKSQSHSTKVEADAATPKTERESDDSIQIPDIERSHSEKTDEGAQINIKLADVKIPTLEFSKIETGASQTEMGVSSAKIDAALPPSEGSFQQVVLKSSSTNEDTKKTGMEFPRGEASIELRSPEIVTERSSVVDGRKMKLEGPEEKIKIPKFQKPKFGISLTKGKGPDTEISSPKIEDDLLQLKRANEIDDIAEGVTVSELASVISDPGEGVHKIKTPQVLTADIEAPKAPEINKDTSLTNRFSMHTLTLEEHKVKSQDIEILKAESSTKLEASGVGCKPSSVESTLDATQEEIDISLPKGELDIQTQEAIIKKEKIKGEMKITGIDSEGNQLKKPTCEWSTTKGSEDGTYVTAKLEDLKVEVPKLKMDIKIARVDPGMKFQVKSVEKDMSAGVAVQVEDRAETSKIKPYRFKIPEFGVLHSEVKAFEDDIDLPKSEADSLSKTEIGAAEMELQKSEASVGMQSAALAHMEASSRITVETLDKSQDGPEVNIKIPKLKIPKFTLKALPTEAEVSVSKVPIDPKGSSTDIEVVQLQASSAAPEETPEALEGGIQKAKSKIVTLSDPDIKTAQVTTTIESSLSNAGQDIHWSYVEGQEVIEKVEPEHVAIERCEIYSTEILKESEILSSEVRTATLGFSLLKVKLPESHSNLEVLVQQPSSIEGVSASKPKCADESSGVTAERIGSAELKLSDKTHTETEEPGGESKTVDKEEIAHKERRLSDEDSPSDKPDVFFDAQESLSPKEKTEAEKFEIDGASSNVPLSQTIVTSSARTELILLEEEKDSQSSIPGDTTK